MPALSARHSAVHSFAVFEPEVVACLAAPVVAQSLPVWRWCGGGWLRPALALFNVGFFGHAPGLHAGLVGAPLRRALFRCLREGRRYGNAEYNSSGDKQTIMIFIFILLIRAASSLRTSIQLGSDCAYAAAEPRASGRKKAAAAALFVAPIAFFDKAVFPIRDRLERMRPN